MKGRLRTHPVPSNAVVIEELGERKGDDGRRDRAADDALGAHVEPQVVELFLEMRAALVDDGMRVVGLLNGRPFQSGVPEVNKQRRH